MRLTFHETRLKLTAAIFRLLVLLIAVQAPMQADSTGTFPGIGDRQQWLKANEYYNEGNDMRHAGRYAESISKYNLAISIYPFDNAYFSNLALAYKKSGDYKSAEANYRRAIKLESKVWNSWGGLGDVLKHLGKFAEAKSAYLQALKFQVPADVKVELEKSVSEVTKQIETPTSREK